MGHEDGVSRYGALQSGAAQPARSREGHLRGVRARGVSDHRSRPRARCDEPNALAVDRCARDRRADQEGSRGLPGAASGVMSELAERFMRLRESRATMTAVREEARGQAVRAIRAIESELVDALDGATLRGLPNLGSSGERFYAIRVRTQQYGEVGPNAE